jgi:hypothetical protein
MTTDQIEQNWQPAGATCACGCGESLPADFLSRHKDGRLYWPGHEPRRPQLDETLDELARVTARWKRLKTAARELIAARFPAAEVSGVERCKQHWMVRPEPMIALEVASQDEE